MRRKPDVSTLILVSWYCVFYDFCLSGDAAAYPGKETCTGVSFYTLTWIEQVGRSSNNLIIDRSLGTIHLRPDLLLFFPAHLDPQIPIPIRIPISMTVLSLVCNPHLVMRGFARDDDLSCHFNVRAFVILAAVKKPLKS